jgi:hypothetical protein
MSRSETYRAQLASLDDWDAYLLQESGLPGPRANLELLSVVAEMGDEARFRHWLTFDAERAPANTVQEYLAVCGTVGLGKLIAEGKRKYLKTLRASASDPRWRVREGVAIALQSWGDRNFAALIDELETWRDGNLYEQRAIAAALCEPRLLREPSVAGNAPKARRSGPSRAKQVLKLLDGITRDFAKSKNRKSADFQTLKKGLAYCWSVAAAEAPEDGKRAMEKWFASDDPDVRAVMRENLKKDRLKRMDAEWVERWQSRLVTMQ